MKYKALVEISIDYNSDEELTKEEYEDIKKYWEQEYSDEETIVKMRVIEFKKDS